MHLFLGCESFLHGSPDLEQLVGVKSFDMLEYLVKYRLRHSSSPYRFLGGRFC